MRSKNILFVTSVRVESMDQTGIYHDVLRDFRKKGHNVFVISPSERRYKLKTKLKKSGGVKILNVKTLNHQRVNRVEKVFSLLTMEYLYLRAIKKYFSGVKFDIIVYTTPPITLAKVVKYVKGISGAFAYLLLKDIFPQNAVDLQLIKKMGLTHKFFLKKERELYEISNKIGCMSKANYEYLIRNNPELDVDKIEINPNTIDARDFAEFNLQRDKIRSKYFLPADKKILVYGGNLGQPQGLEFLLETIQDTSRSDVFFLIAGSGTEYIKIFEWFKINQPQNAKLVEYLPKQQYEEMLSSCDVGLIFLSPRFTFPNYPSRLLSYLEMKLPVIAATDINTDIGDDIEKYKCGFSVTSGNTREMQRAISKLTSDDELYEKMQRNGHAFLLEKFNVNITTTRILDSVVTNQ
ncbi:glycosyltransferase family 4 protein [Akkermansiaceae bacterium]|nr:glycosyltransferase family 4 protein [Akkermansiaceae bacterium]